VAEVRGVPWLKNTQFSHRLDGLHVRQGGRRGVRAPVCVEDGLVWYADSVASMPELTSLLCGNRKCGLCLQATPSAFS